MRKANVIIRLICRDELEKFQFYNNINILDFIAFV